MFTAFRPDLARPTGLRPSAPSLTIVCGAPCAGKSSFVRRFASGGDVVIDLDEIASGLAGSALHAWPRGQWLHRALARRNELLSALGSGGGNPDASAWFIVGAPGPDERKWWRSQLRPVRIVTIETDADTCLDRLFADPDRAAYRSGTVVGINEWWGRYRRGEGDVVSGATEGIG